MTEPVLQSLAEETQDLAGRVATLEAERRRILREAQQEADTVFAQYQLSQLLASGDSLHDLAEAVLEELTRGTGAAAAALWLAPPAATGLERVATVSIEAGPTPDPPIPDRLPGSAAAVSWCAAHGWYGVALEEQRDLGLADPVPAAVGFLALGAARERPLAPDHARFLSLVRHELAIAFRAAQLRETLDHERAVLGAILEGARDAIVAVDAERRIVRLNAAAGWLTGRDTGAAVGGLCEAFLGCRGGPRRRVGEGALLCGVRCPFADVLAGGPPIADREGAVLGPDDLPVPVAGSYARMPGGAVGAVAVLRDLRPSRELDQLKASFVAAVSHELRTPLALISGYAQSLDQLELSEATRRRYVERIEGTTKRLGGLVDQILEIARVDGDQLELEAQPVALAGIVRRICRELGAAPGGRPIRVSVAAHLPLVLADEGRVGQMLANLLENALKYAADGPIAVSAAPGPEGVVVRVVDAGPGIEAADREHVFERFYRGRRVRESARPGSGLGLYLCQRLAEAQGGRIWLDEVPVGTSIAFSLPLAGRPAVVPG